MSTADVRIERRPDGNWNFRALNERARHAIDYDLFDWYEPAPVEDGAHVVTAMSLESCRRALIQAGFTVEEE